MSNRRQGLDTAQSITTPATGGSRAVHRMGLGERQPMTSPSSTTPARWSTGGRSPHTEQDLDGDAGPAGPPRQPGRAAGRIERASGLVVDRLLAAGHPVVPIAPQRVPRRPAPLGRRRRQVRPRRQLQARRLPAHRRPPAAPAGARRTRPPASCKRWSGCATTTSRAKTAATNQLGALLDAHWPGAKQLFFRLDRARSPWRSSTDYPTPQAAARLGQARAGRVLPPPLLPRRPPPGRAARSGCAPPRATGRA